MPDSAPHRLLITYGPLVDPAAFDVHTGLVKATPDLLRFSTGHAMTVDG